MEGFWVLSAGVQFDFVIYYFFTGIHDQLEFAEFRWLVR
jgi:hypothetical protein